MNFVYQNFFAVSGRVICVVVRGLSGLRGQTAVRRDSEECLDKSPSQASKINMLT